MSEIVVRRATSKDSTDVARLLHAFNTEFGEPTPGERFLTKRVGALLESNEIIALVVGEAPEGLAVLRLRPALWAGGLDAYLEELYVTPHSRGGGLGRALLAGSMKTAREAGGVRIEVATGETDTAARALYESAGFTNREEGGRGTQMLFYEREL